MRDFRDKRSAGRILPNLLNKIGIPKTLDAGFVKKNLAQDFQAKLSAGVILPTLSGLQANLNRIWNVCSKKHEECMMTLWLCCVSLSLSLSLPFGIDVCMYRGRSSWRCPWDRTFQLGQGGGDPSGSWVQYPNPAVPLIPRHSRWIILAHLCAFSGPTLL